MEGKSIYSIVLSQPDFTDYRDDLPQRYRVLKFTVGQSVPSQQATVKEIKLNKLRYQTYREVSYVIILESDGEIFPWREFINFSDIDITYKTPKTDEIEKERLLKQAGFEDEED